MHSGHPSTARDGVTVSIIVKALNEEKHIAACLESALQEVQGVDAEVILVDSLSTDRTVEIARGLPVRVVQFVSSSDRNCGAALQLGYQYARGDYIYVLDGDMTLVPGFIRAAMDYLDGHPDVAGVGGKLVDSQVLNLADKLRVAYYDTLSEEQDVAVLGGGGLYRRVAIEQVGYLANRWLPAFEEAELGARLLAKRWRLVRLPRPAVTHSGHNENSYQLLMRLWRIGRIEASGTLLRAAFGRDWSRQALRACWFVFAAPVIYLAVLLLTGIGVRLGAPPVPTLLASLLATWGGAWALLAWRKKEGREALLSLLAWHLYTAGALRGFVRRVRDPGEPIAARVLK
ncbi:glycosyltransferase [Rugamonas sp. FT29W]|uniref:Glycosyltransferase n=1 Tax=Rugamonas aquatica TaxID=2743357 RepID=A0A6A7MZ24_9BURK|nr:glycosyltransferase [Rugamonas aquatica]